RYQLIQTRLVRPNERLPRMISHDAAGRRPNELPIPDHPGVDRRKHGAVDDERPELFHQVEGERGTTVTRLMVESPPGIEPLAQQGDGALLRKKCITKR